MGGLNPLKGIKDVIRAFEILSQRSTATLIIAGKGKATKSLKILAREKEVAHRTHFTGYVDEKDLPKLYNSADVLVWPSYLGFGLPTLEAMSCGTPVVCADALDAREYVDGGGLMYPPSDVQVLSERLVSVVGSKKEWKEWSSRGIKWSEKFSWDKMSDEVISAYSQLANL